MITLGACATIQYAIDNEATTSGTVSVAAGTYAESVTVTDELTLTATGAAVIAPPATSTYGVSIGANNVTIDGFDIDGTSASTTMWAGIMMFGAYSGVSITDNEIHDFDGINPSSSWGAGATIKYAYGIWTMGGGTPGSRGSITGLTITGNNIHDLGDGATTGGVGMYLKSIWGATAGAGATIQGNTVDEMVTGPTEVSGVSFTFVGVGIGAIQDDDLSSIDSGVQIGGETAGTRNTMGDGAGVDMVAAIDVQTANSSVDQEGGDFGSGVTAWVITKPVSSGGALVATVDEGQLAPFVKSAEVDVNGVGAGVPFAGVTGYFADLTSASANSVAGTDIQLTPSDPGGGPISVGVTFVDPIITIMIGGDTFTVNKDDLELFGQALVINGTSVNDDLTVDPDAVPSTGLYFDAGDGDDTLTLSAAGVLNSAYTHTPNTVGACSTGENGNIDFDATGDIDYCGLTPIIDLTTLASKAFNFTAADETITIIEDPADPTRTLIDSATMESVSFENPTDFLIVNAGDGDDTIVFGGLGSSNAADLDSVELNGEGDEDTLQIDPVLAATYSALTIEADGGNPFLCQGDLLDFVLGAGQTVSFSVPPPADGTATFGIVLDVAVVYTNFEVFADQSADLQVTTVILDDNSLYAGDNGTVTINVENLGTESALCVQVDLSGLPGILNIDEDNSVTDFDPVVSDGTFDRTTKIWSISSLASLGSETLTIPFVVDTQLTGLFQIPATISAGNEDPDPTNNAEDDTLNVTPAFAFPAKGHAIAVAFGTLASGLERMVIGTFLGSPGINGAVWCRISDSDGDILTLSGVAARYRVCSDGLPNISGSFLPLHVNDIWLDDDGAGQGRYWMTTWGNDGLYYSDDDAETWNAAQPDLGDGYSGGSKWVNVYAITEDFADGILYVSVNNGLIFRSLNGGGNWQQVSSLPEGSADTAWSLRSHPITAGLLYAGTFGRGVYVSTNFGITWDPLEFNSTLTAAQAAHIFDIEVRADPVTLTEYIFVATSRGIWRKDLDMLADWEEIPSPSITPSGISPEVRSIEFGNDKDVDGDPDLYGVTWGFGIIAHPTPFDTPFVTDLEDFALRGSEMTFFAISPSGMMYAGTNDGAFYEMDPQNPIAGTATLTDPESELPTSVALHQNYPNPFNPTTTIEFALPETSEVLVAVYDVLGRTVRVLQQGILSAGLHRVSFDAKDLPSGTYFYRLETPGAKITRQFVLLK